MGAFGKALELRRRAPRNAHRQSHRHRARARRARHCHRLHRRFRVVSQVPVRRRNRNPARPTGHGRVFRPDPPAISEASAGMPRPSSSRWPSWSWVSRRGIQRLKQAPRCRCSSSCSARCFVPRGHAARRRSMATPTCSCRAGRRSPTRKPGCLRLGRRSSDCRLPEAARSVYGSYLKKDVNVVASARNVVVFSTLAAVLSAMVVVPAVFAFGADHPGRPPASVHRASAGVRGDALRRAVLLRVLPGRSLRRHHQLGEPLRAANRGAAAAGAPSPLGRRGHRGRRLHGRRRLHRESGDAVSAWMDAVSIYAIPVGSAYSGRDVLLGIVPKGFASKQAQMGREKPVGVWFELMGRLSVRPAHGDRHHPGHRARRHRITSRHRNIARNAASTAAPTASQNHCKACMLHVACRPSHIMQGKPDSKSP